MTLKSSLYCTSHVNGLESTATGVSKTQESLNWRLECRRSCLYFECFRSLHFLAFCVWLRVFFGNSQLAVICWW